MKHSKNSARRIIFYMGFGIEKDGHRGICGPEKRFLQTCQILDSTTILPIVIYPYFGRLFPDFEQLHHKQQIILIEYAPKNRWDYVGILYKTIKRFSPYAIHCQGPNLFDTIAVVLGKWLRINVIITRPVNISQDHLSTFKKIAFKVMDQMVIRHANHLVAISDTHERQWLKELMPLSSRPSSSKMQVIYNGIHLNTYTVPLNRPEPYPVIFTICAQLTPVKGHKLLIRGVHQLHKAGYQLCLNILGDGPLKLELESLVNALNISSIVYFHGHVSNVASVLKKTHVVVLPSLREGVSLALLEGLATGCPLIASRVGASHELIDNGKNGFLIKKNNSLELFLAMKWFLDYPSTIRTMGEKSRLKSQKFDIYRMVNDYRKLYLLS
ncbi:MAG: glycosyltransferase [Candidatus Magnetomorum sp.]|nr:glycosyltransferase [Candidatus Magnetomorum sp.]